MADLFKGILPSITTTKVYLDEIDGYNAFVVNQALSNHIDCVLHANEMNMVSHLTPKMQYDYYFNTIRKTKRPFSYVKKQKDVELDWIKEYFSCSISKAKEILPLLSKKQLANIEKIIDKGGK